MAFMLSFGALYNALTALGIDIAPAVIKLSKSIMMIAEFFARVM